MTGRPSTPAAETATPVEPVGATEELHWLGLEPYRVEHRRLYYGREEDADELRRRVRSSRSTLLLGKMGSGKTSLLQASFLPEEREKGCLPVYVRLDFSAGAPKLGSQVKQAIHAAATRAGLDGPEPTEGESLWEYLHLAAGEFWTEDYQIALPMIVLDQFEEILTLGQAGDRVEDSEAFVSELSDLIEGRVPAELRLRVLDDPADEPRYAPKRHHYKIIVSLRDEALADLDRHRRVLPLDLLHNRCRLTPIDGEEAMRVVTKAGAGIVDDVVAEGIVRKVAGDEDNETPLQALDVEPAILSVFCRWLDDERAKEGMDEITLALLEKFGDRILLDFYEDSLNALPGRPRWRRWPTWFVHRFVENRLLTAADARTRADAPDAGRTRLLRMETRLLRMDRKAAETLRDRHVLRILPHDGHDRKDQVELSHDVLIESVRQSGRRRRRKMLGVLLRAAIVLLVLFGVGVPTAAYIGMRVGRNSNAGSPLAGFLGDYVDMFDALNRITRWNRGVIQSIDSGDTTAAESARDSASEAWDDTVFARVCPPEAEDEGSAPQAPSAAAMRSVTRLLCDNHELSGQHLDLADSLVSGSRIKDLSWIESWNDVQSHFVLNSDSIQNHYMLTVRDRTN